MTTAQIYLPPKLIPVFTGEADVRGAYGGRGSAKTMSFAKMTAIRAYMWDQAGAEGVIVCGRERLNSIDDSSLAEVRSAIESEPWLREHFDLGDKYIRTKSKRIAYKFSGMDKKTILSIKSKAKIRLLWADEAEPISDMAWDIVIPTLRQEDSELWVTWNPARKSSATDRRFRQAKDPRMKVVELNWRDNPKFPAILERQRVKWQRENPDTYDWVWEGAYASAIKGAYFTKQITAMKAEGRYGPVPRDPLMKRRLFVDIGGTGRNSDAFTMWGAQFVGLQVRVLNYYETVGQEISFHLAWMERNGYKPDNTEIFLPHDGATHDKVYDVSYESAFEAAGFSVTVVPNQGRGAAISRINAARRMFPAVWMNKETEKLIVDVNGRKDATTDSGLEALGWYHEKWDEERDIGLGPEHDWASHGCFHGDTKVLTRYGTYRIMDLPSTGEVLTPCGWKQYINPRMTKRDAQLVEVIFAGGHSVKCTPDHLFLTDSGWKSAESLTRTSAILSTLTKSRSISMVACIVFGRAIDTFRAAESAFIAMFGSLHSALFRKTATYTTRTVTHSITESKTSNAKMHASICRTAVQNGLATHSQKPLELALPFGINLKRAVFGISATQSELRGGLNGNAKKSHASIAARCLVRWCEKAETLVNIAKSLVKSPLIENAGRQMSMRLHIERVRQLKETADVWDITVPDGHCFSLENGAVVHNSDSFGLMAVVWEDHSASGATGARRPGSESWRRGRKSGMAV